MNELLMNWKLAEIIDSWDEEDHEPTPDEEAVVSILLLIEGHVNDLLILSNKYGRADSASISGFYALDAMQRRGVPGSVQTRFLKKLRQGACRLFDIQTEEMERLMKNRLGVFSDLIRNSKYLTSFADEAALLFSYDIEYNRYVDFFRNSPVILMDFSTQSQILMESKAFFQAVIPLILKSIDKFGTPTPQQVSQQAYRTDPRSTAASTTRSKPYAASKTGVKSVGIPKWYWLTVAALVAVIIFGILGKPLGANNYGSDSLSSPTESVQQTVKTTLPTQTEPRPVLRQVAKPFHGEIFEEFTIEGLAPFSVTGTGDIYLVLDPIDLSDSVEIGVGEQQASLDEKYMEMRVFLRSGMTFETDVPLGKYEVYYATGDAWYGEEHLFGPDTQYYKCDEIFNFTMDDEGYNGWTLTLTAVFNGNLDTDSISAGDFPK